MIEVEQLKIQKRGDGGFGHTGLVKNIIKEREENVRLSELRKGDSKLAKRGQDGNHRRIRSCNK